MRHDLDPIKRLDPIANDSAKGWTVSEEGDRVLKRVVEGTQDGVGNVTARHPDTRINRPWLAGVVTAVATLILIGVPSFLFGGKDQVAPEQDIGGNWLLVSFQLDGSTELVEPGVNAAEQPWIEIGTSLRGNGGCNDFESLDPGSYSFIDGVLITGEILQTASLCVENGSLMRTEDLFFGVMRENTDGIRVRLEGEEMVWIADDIRLVFRKAEALPTTSAPSLAQSHGRLDCSPGFIRETTSGDVERDPEQLLREVSEDVVRVEAEPPSFWWGYDTRNRVVAAVAKGDFQPSQYHIFTCTQESP